MIGHEIDTADGKYTDGYTVIYSDGVDEEEIFADQTSIVPAGDKTPAFDGEEPSRESHDFKGWDSDIADTGAPAKPGKVVKAENVTSPKTGDTSNSVMWLAVMLIGGSAAVAATIVKKNK